jgi:hypothetical protein
MALFIDLGSGMAGVVKGILVHYNPREDHKVLGASQINVLHICKSFILIYPNWQAGCEPVLNNNNSEHPVIDW